MRQIEELERMLKSPKPTPAPEPEAEKQQEEAPPKEQPQAEVLFYAVSDGSSPSSFTVSELAYCWFFPLFLVLLSSKVSLYA